jgi:hypothetical protein
MQMRIAFGAAALATVGLLGGAGAAAADSGAQGGASNSPGVVSGNNVQVPVHVPINACGNSLNIIGALNPAHHNQCKNN